MGLAYQSKGVSKTLESSNVDDATLLSAAPLQTRQTTVASQATYGVNENKYTGKLVIDAKNVTPTADLKVRVTVGAVLKKEITYTTSGFKEDVIFSVEPGDVVSIELSSNLATGSVVADDMRLLVINSELKDCVC